MTIRDLIVLLIIERYEEFYLIDSVELIMDNGVSRLRILR